MNAAHPEKTPWELLGEHWERCVLMAQTGPGAGPDGPTIGIADMGNGPYAFRPDEVLVIGDTPLDIDCARAFGAVAVAVATGFHKRDELLGEQPDLFFEDFSDVDAAAAALLSATHRS